MKTKKTETLKPAISEAVPILPEWLIGLLFAGWAYFVLSSYYGAGFMGSLWPFRAPAVNPAAFFIRFWENLTALLSAFFIFFAGFGVGSNLLDLFFEKKNVTPSLFGDFKEKFVFSTILGLGIIALIVFFLGLSGLLLKWSLICLIGIFSLAGVRKLALFKGISFGRKTFPEKTGLFLFFLIALFNLFGALTPEIFYDSQFYQLGVVNYWLSQHKMLPNTFIPSSFFPFNINMLYLAGMMLNSEITAKLVHYLCGLMLSYAIYVFSKKYFNRTTAVFAALIFYSIPNVMIVSWKTAIELGIGVFEFAMLFSLVNFIISKNRRWLILSGIFCGFSLGSKYTGIAFCFIPALVTIAASGLFEKENIQSIAKNVFIFIICAALISLPWYLRNFLMTGDPVFPFFWQKIGFEKIRAAGSLFSDPAYPKFTLFNYLFFLWPLTMGGLQQEASLGPVFLVFVLFLFLFRHDDFKIKIISVYFLTAMVFWMFLGRFYVRYFIPVLASASVIMAFYLFNQKTGRLFKKAVFAVLAVMVFANLMYSNMLNQGINDPLPYFLGASSKKDYLSTQKMSYPHPYYQTLEYANRTIKPDAKILFLGETRGLYCERKFIASGAGDYNQLVEWALKSESGDELYKKLRESGVTHFLFNIPETVRLSSYDTFYLDEKSLKVLNDFWARYIKETYKDVADIAIPIRGIYSFKNEQPAWWADYSRDPRNYVYLYEIMDKNEAIKPHKAPLNTFLFKEIYSNERWKKLEQVIIWLRKNYA